MATRDTAWPDGTPCWVDYGAEDVEAAKAFYAELLDWTYEGGGEEFGGYLTALHGGRPAAGLMPMMAPDQRPAWTTYFASSDAAAATERITAAGGTVVAPPMAVADLGQMAIALDPEGLAFGVWQAATFPGFQVFNEPGSVVWNEAAADDPDAERTFYAAVFGFRYDPVDGADRYTTFATTDRPLGGLGGAEPGAVKGWTTCFSVASADDAVATVERLGGKVVVAPQTMEFGRFAVLEDPWGAHFSVMAEPAGQ